MPKTAPTDPPEPLAALVEEIEATTPVASKPASARALRTPKPPRPAPQPTILPNRRPQLTPAYIKALPPAGTDALHPAPRYSEFFGQEFGIRVTARTKTWYFNYRLHGRKYSMQLGTYPAVSLADARKAHGAMLVAVQSGHNPAEKTQQAKADARRKADADAAAKVQAEAGRGPTLAEVFELWVANRLKHRLVADGKGRLRPRGRKDNGKEARGYFTHHGVLARLGHRHIAELQRRDYMQVIDESLAKAKPRATDVLLAYLKQFLMFADLRGYVEGSVLGSVDRSEIVGKFSTRDRALDDWEIVRLLERLPHVGLHPTTVLALRFVLCTGARPGEAVGMLKSDLNADRSLWSIPAERYKTGVPHIVPLSDHARELLAQVDRFNAGSVYMFTSPQAGLVPPSDPAKAAKRKRQPKDAPITERALSQGVRDKLGTATAPDVQPAASELAIAQFTPHDLRRSCRTQLGALGVPEAIAERVIGHLPQGIVGVYDRHAYLDQRREALSLWGDKLAKLTKLAADGVKPRTEQDLRFLVDLLFEKRGSS